MDETAPQRDMKELSLKLGYAFTRPELLAEALRHASYVNEVGDPELRDNERLEFLGDAVLDLAVSHLLMDVFREAKEGHLSKWRAAVVNERVLSELARELELGTYLVLGKGEEIAQQVVDLAANEPELGIGKDAKQLFGGFPTHQRGDRPGRPRGPQPGQPALLEQQRRYHDIGIEERAAPQSRRAHAIASSTSDSPIPRSASLALTLFARSD